MNVRAKFQVVSVEQFAGDQAKITLAAIHGADNRTWSKWTPSGDLTLSCTNPGATAQFVSGKCVFIDFSDAPDKESDETK
jgi:hypothetical protein